MNTTEQRTPESTVLVRVRSEALVSVLQEIREHIARSARIYPEAPGLALSAEGYDLKRWADFIEAEIERLERAENDQWQAAQQMRKAWRDRGEEIEKLQRKLMIVTNFPTHPGGHPGDQSDDAMCEDDWRHGWICAVSAIQDALAATDQEPTP